MSQNNMGSQSHVYTMSHTIENAVFLFFFFSRMGKANKQKSSLVKQSQPKHPHRGGGSKHGGVQGQKPAAFKVSSHKALKAKHKAKQVTSNLKWVSVFYES